MKRRRDKKDVTFREKERKKKKRDISKRLRVIVNDLERKKGIEKDKKKRNGAVH